MNRGLLLLAAAPLALFVASARAETITIAALNTPHELDVLRQELAAFTASTGIDVRIAPIADGPLSPFDQYQRRLSEHDASIDVYRTDITWAPQLARYLVDLGSAAGDIAATELPALVGAETVGGKLTALPYLADIGALYYRKDLLAQYHLGVPATWADMAARAATVMDGENGSGSIAVWGYVFPGAPSEDLTANALEWIASNGGGGIVEADGTISVDNVPAILGVEAAEKWVGTVTPPDVVSFAPADARSLWLSGKAVFTRDWHDLIALDEAASSPVKDKVGVWELPVGEHGDRPAAALGGWSLAVSRYSDHQDAAIALVRFLASTDAERRYEAVALRHLPAISALYDDPDVAKAEPEIATYKRMLNDAVVRPAAQTGEAYRRVSGDFALAMNRSLKRDAFAEDLIQSYRHDLEFMARAGWKPTTPRGQIGDTAP